MGTVEIDWNSVAAINNATYWMAGPLAIGQRAAVWDDVQAADPETLTIFPNSACLTRPLAGDPTEVMVRLRSFYAAGKGAGWLLWSAWPTPDLSSHGMVLMGHPPLMVRPPAPLPDGPPLADFEIVEVDSEALVSEWIDVVAHGYPAPELRSAGAPLYMDRRALGGPLRLWLGLFKGRAVSCVANVADEHVNGVFTLATLPEFRGRGFGLVMTQAAVGAAPSLPAWLTASELGFPIYQKLGFAPASQFTIWMCLDRKPA